MFLVKRLLNYLPLPFAGANAAIDTSRADGTSSPMFDTEEEHAGLHNSDKGQISNYENTHQTSDLDDKREGREKDNKLHCQERPELSDVTTLSRYEGTAAAIDSFRADGESLSMVDTCYVEGARNKIISTSFDETQVDGRLCTRPYTEGAITEGIQKHRYVLLG